MMPRIAQGGGPKRWRRQLVFSLFASLSGLIVLEGAARLVMSRIEDDAPARFSRTEVWAHAAHDIHQPDDELFWKLRPGYESGSVRTNRLGLRGPEVVTPKPDGVRRVLLLGDSTTFGFGLDEPAIFARRLGEELARTEPAEPADSADSYEIVNAGTIGYSSFQGKHRFEQLRDRLEPDLVVAMFGYNDHHSALQSDRAKAEAGSTPAADVLQWLRDTGSFRLLERLLGRSRRALTAEPVARVDLADFEANLIAIDRLAREVGARAVFLTVPLREDVPLVENFRAVHDPARPDARVRVWMRQLDLARERLADRLPAAGSGRRGEDLAAVVERHFLASGDLAPLVRDPRCVVQLRGLVDEHPELPVFHYLLGRCLEARGALAEAELAFESARRTDRERSEVEAYNAMLRRFAAQGRLAVVDVARAFAERGDEPGELFLDVVHPTAAGHALLAERLAAAIRDGRARSPSPAFEPTQ